MGLLPSVPKTVPESSGRDCFGRNVAFAWGGYMVNVISGFLVPRLISDQLGQVALGVWDFAWSFVSYFGLVQLGMGGSISRYVANFRAKNDTDGLNRSVSTIALFQRSVGWLALVLAAVSACWILPVFEERLGDQLESARWVILILGTQISIMISLSVYGAVIVGCHRWDLHNTISAVSYGFMALGMTTILMLGGGLELLAFVHCVIMVGAELVRRQLVKRVCPELVVRFRIATWSTFVEQSRYSIKSLVPSIANLLSNQALSLLIVAFLGPASLAIFSRSRGLMTTLRTLSAKFGMIVVPIASEFHAQRNREGLRDALLTTPAIISSLVLPILFAIGVFGDQLMKLWMGQAYVQPGLIAVMTVGIYATLVQEPVWSLLSGMNCHGRIAIAKLIAACISAILLAIGLWGFRWGLLGAASCFVLPQMVVDGFITPWYACHVVGVSKLDYLWRTFVRPILCITPFGASLAIGAILNGNHPLLALSTIGGGSLLCFLAYLKWLVPHSTRNILVDFLIRIIAKKSMGV